MHHLLAAVRAKSGRSSFWTNSCKDILATRALGHQAACASTSKQTTKVCEDSSTTLLKSHSSSSFGRPADAALREVVLHRSAGLLPHCLLSKAAAD